MYHPDGHQPAAYFIMPLSQKLTLSRTGVNPVLLVAVLATCLAILSGGAARAELSESVFRDPPAAALLSGPIGPVSLEFPVQATIKLN